MGQVLRAKTSPSNQERPQNCFSPSQRRKGGRDVGMKMNALTANERCEESDALLLREVVSIAVAKVVPETVSESGADFSSSIVALGN